MSHSLEASLVFNDSLAANETLAALGKQGQFAVAEVINVHKKRFAYWSWNPKDNNDTLGALVSRWLFPVPIAQPIMHNGSMIGEIRLTARDSLISHFIWMSFAVLLRLYSFCHRRRDRHYPLSASRHGHGPAKHHRCGA